MLEGAEPATRPPRARWTRLAALGLVLVGVAPALYLAAIAIWGLDVAAEDLGFLLPLVVIPWVAAFLVWRFGTWARIVGVVVAVLAIGLLFWTAFGLQHPASFFDFMPGVLVVPGALLAIVASIAAIVAARRGHLTARAEGGERRAIGVVTASVLLLALVSGVLTVVGQTTVEAGGDATEVGFRNGEFDRETYEVAGGSEIVVRNLDPFAHTFTIDALEIDVVLGPRSSALVAIPTEPGDYIVYCVYHTTDPDSPGSDDMAADWTIQ